LGLNLKERSSGHRQGELAIAKRGSSRARRWIFYWALRAVQREELPGWYADFTQVGRKSSNHGKREARRMKGVVALMRKLARGLRYEAGKKWDWLRAETAKTLENQWSRRCLSQFFPSLVTR
jgi:transposase